MASFDDISINTMIGGGSAFYGDLRVSGGMMIETLLLQNAPEYGAILLLNLQS